MLSFTYTNLSSEYYVVAGSSQDQSLASAKTLSDQLHAGSD